MKTKKRYLSAFCLLLCALFALCGCGGNEPLDWTSNVEIHTFAQSEYLKGDYNDIQRYATGSAELSRPEPVHFDWSEKTAEENVKEYTIELSLSKDFSDSVSYSTTDTSIDIYNLFIGSTYYWRVNAKYTTGKSKVCYTAMLSTSEAAPRNLYVDGITNVRDLGGWMTADGGTVRQGMIYRCGRLNKSGVSEPIIQITEKGIDTMRNQLGIRSEIDLRMKVDPNGNPEVGGITSSPLGEDINYYNVELQWDNGNFLLYNVEAVKEFFHLAADESNYPFIFHCNIGTDRTGMFAFLINGMLGVDEEDLYRDYLFSNFGAIEGNARSLKNIENNYLKTIAEAEGDTLSERIENSLLAIGVPQEHLDAVKAIMSE